MIELMIAMAILIIMMSFLFQFSISAQRLWSVSNNNDIVFEQAQLCFDLLEKDLKAVIVQDEVTNPGRAIPYYVNTAANLDGTAAAQLLFLVTQAGSSQTPLDPTNGSDAFPVVYYLDASKNLYRRVIDTDLNAKKPLYCFGLTATEFNNYLTAMDNVFLPETSPYRLCENLTSVKLDLHSSSTVDVFHLPEVVKITLELMDPSGAQQLGNANPEVKTRVFSKTIFLR